MSTDALVLGIPALLGAMMSQSRHPCSGRTSPSEDSAGHH